MFIFRKKKEINFHPRLLKGSRPGYDENSKAYKIYDPRHRKIVNNIDVKSDESSCFSYKIIPSELLSLEAFYNHPTSASIYLRKVQPNLSPYAQLPKHEPSSLSPNQFQVLKLL